MPLRWTERGPTSSSFLQTMVLPEILYIFVENR